MLFRSSAADYFSKTCSPELYVIGMLELAGITFGIPVWCVSSFSNYSVEDVVAAGRQVGPIAHAMQLYTMKDRAMQERSKPSSSPVKQKYNAADHAYGFNEACRGMRQMGNEETIAVSGSNHGELPVAHMMAAAAHSLHREKEKEGTRRPRF